MLTDRDFGIVTALGFLALVLVAAAVLVTGMNREVRAEVAARQDAIQRGKELEGLYREIVRALADLSVRNRDDELKRLLANQGIAVKVEPPAAGDGARR